MVHHETSRLVRWLKICGLIIPAVVFLWLASQYFIAFGSTIYHASFGHARNGILSLVHEADVVAKRQFRRDTLRWYVASPSVPFTIRFTRIVEQAKLSFRLTGAQHYITALSAQYSSGIFGSKTILLRHQQLDQLAWEHVSHDGLTLWQRPYRFSGTSSDAKPVAQYASISDFFAGQKDFSTTAIVDQHSLAYQRLPGYQPQSELRTIPHSFRGSHTIIFYVGAEPIDVRFSFLDLNQTARENRSTVLLSRLDDIRISGQEPLQTVVVADDGRTDGKKIPSSRQPVEIKMNNPQPGYYRLQIIASEETVIQDLQTRQSVFFFESSLSMVDGSRVVPQEEPRPAIIQMMGKNLAMTTAQVSTVVRVNIREQGYDVRRGRPTKVVFKESTQQLSIPIADLDLRTNGYFAFENFSLPPSNGANQVAVTATVDTEKIDYILAHYEPQTTTKPVSYAVDLPMQKLALHDKRLHFQLDTAGLDSRTSTLRVDDVNIEYRRSISLWKKFLLRFTNVPS